MIKLHHERTFRRTPGVHFADIGVPGSNGIDLVEHHGPSISPPNKGRRIQFYVHQHQTDNNRVIQGRRLFELYNGLWNKRHWFVMLDESSGALEIPPGTLHRSYSGLKGSILLNHAIRTDEYDETKEFNPVPMPLSGHFARTYYHGCDLESVTRFIQEGY